MARRNDEPKHWMTSITFRIPGWLNDEITAECRTEGTLRGALCRQLMVLGMRAYRRRAEALLAAEAETQEAG